VYSYAKTYSVVFPHDEALAGRDFRKSAIHDDLLDLGCVFQERHSFERVGWFDIGTNDVKIKAYDYYGGYENGMWRLGNTQEGDVSGHDSHPYAEIIERECTFGWPASHEIVAAECNLARQGVAIFDQSYFGKFYLYGADADRAIDYICGARMDNRTVGDVVYTPLCNKKGIITIR